MTPDRIPDPRTYPDVHPALSVADVGVVDGAMGPGRRLAVWLQGCRKRCPGCVNPAYLPVARARVLTVGDLLARLDATPGAAGVSLSGGEPVLQAEALLPLLDGVRARGLTVVSYTGYDLADLTGPAAPAALQEFVARVDLLVAGPYVRESPRAGPFRESGNQRLHFPGGRIRPDELDGGPAHEVTLGGPRSTWTGPLPEAVYRRIADGLRALGVDVGPRPTG